MRGAPWWATALRLTGLGWYVALCIVLGIVGGVLLDKLTGTLPLFTIAGTVLGSVAAFCCMYKMVLPVIYGAKRQDMNRKRKNR